MADPLGASDLDRGHTRPIEPRRRPRQPLGENPHEVRRRRPAPRLRRGGQREREVPRPEHVDTLEHGLGDRLAPGVRRGTPLPWGGPCRGANRALPRGAISRSREVKGPRPPRGRRAMVGAAGFEPATSCSQSTCATVAPHPDGCERQYGTLLQRARAPGRQAGTGRGLTSASGGGWACEHDRGRGYPPTRNARPATTSTPSMITTKARSGSRSTMRLPSADPAIIRGPMATPMATDRAERIDAWP